MTLFDDLVQRRLLKAECHIAKIRHRESWSFTNGVAGPTDLKRDVLVCNVSRNDRPADF